MTCPRWGAWAEMSLGGRQSQLTPELETFRANEYPSFTEPCHMPGPGQVFIHWTHHSQKNSSRKGLLQRGTGGRVRLSRQLAKSGFISKSPDTWKGG